MSDSIAVRRLHLYHVELQQYKYLTFWLRYISNCQSSMWHDAEREKLNLINCICEEKKLSFCKWEFFFKCAPLNLRWLKKTNCFFFLEIFFWVIFFFYCKYPENVPCNQLVIIPRGVTISHFHQIFTKKTCSSHVENNLSANPIICFFHASALYRYNIKFNIVYWNFRANNNKFFFFLFNERIHQCANKWAIFLESFGPFCIIDSTASNCHYTVAVARVNAPGMGVENVTRLIKDVSTTMGIFSGVYFDSCCFFFILAMPICA